MADSSEEETIKHFNKLMRATISGDIAEVLSIMDNPPKGVKSGVGLAKIEPEGIRFILEQTVPSK